MPFADVTNGSRIILAGIGGGDLIAVAAVLPGDLMTEAGGLADANAAVPATAYYIAGHKAAAGDRVRAYRTALVDGVSGATLGNRVYLSDTPGGYSEAVSATQRQAIGYAMSATQLWIELNRGLERCTVVTSFAAADVVNTVAAKVFYIATQRVRVTKISEIHAVVAGQAGTLDIERLQAVEAPGAAAGDPLLAAAKIDLAATIHTVQSPALSATAALLVLEIGDRLALKLATGSAATLANATLAVEIEPA